MTKPLGILIIEELKSRKKHGGYFNFSEIQKLKKVENSKQLKNFLTEANYPDIVISENPANIIDQLEKENEPKTGFLLGNFFTDLLLNIFHLI